MTIAGLAAGRYGADSATANLLTTRARLDDLQRQLATGKVSTTYGGLNGPARVTALDARAKLAAIAGYRANITDAGLRARLMDTSLDTLGKLANGAKSSLIQPAFLPDGSGRTLAQQLAAPALDQAIDALNQEAGGRYLFAGRASDVRPVLDQATILNGDGVRDGLRTLINERKAADRGAGTGRLALGGAGASATLAEDGNGLFGFALAGASSSLSNATLTGPAGAPPALDVTFSGQPASGEALNVTLALRDGTTETITLTARTTLDPAATGGQFAIGATPAATAANLRAALAAAVAAKADGPLAAASAVIAGDDLFAGSATNPPRRVAGPFATATAFQAPATAAGRTVTWYRGDDDASVAARDTAPVRGDDGLVVGAGARANEPGIARVMARIAVLAAESFATGAGERDRFQGLGTRLRAGLADAGGPQSVATIQGELATAHATLTSADARLSARSGVLDAALSGAEDADKEAVATSILSLQTRLQASYQVTASLGRLSLADYLR